jgi:acetophenone carboxylase
MLVGNGLFGGYPAVTTPGAFINRSNLMELLTNGEKSIPTTPEEVLKSNVIKESTEPGTPGMVYEGALRAMGSAAGGYGYGDVLERDPQAVVDDIRNEIVSDWSASHVYRVAYDAETWTADTEETARLRKAEHEDRLRRSKRYSEFEHEWLKRKPPEEQLANYGSWPDAKVVRPIIRI